MQNCFDRPFFTLIQVFDTCMGYVGIEKGKGKEREKGRGIEKGKGSVRGRGGENHEDEEKTLFEWKGFEKPETIINHELQKKPVEGFMLRRRTRRNCRAGIQDHE
ncbi:MAG: hypothetical protein ACC613_00200 [Synergistales bacterium]